MFVVLIALFTSTSLFTLLCGEAMSLLMFFTVVVILLITTSLLYRTFAGIYRDTYVQKNINRRTLLLIFALLILWAYYYQRLSFLYTLSVLRVYTNLISLLDSEHSKSDLIESFNFFKRVMVFYVWRYCRRLLNFLDIIFQYKLYTLTKHFQSGAAFSILLRLG